jgi:hypothetical protein
MDVEDAEPLTQRTKIWTPSDEIEDMIQRAETKPSAIVYGTYQYRVDQA